MTVMIAVAPNAISAAAARKTASATKISMKHVTLTKTATTTRMTHVSPTVFPVRSVGFSFFGFQ